MKKTILFLLCLGLALSLCACTAFEPEIGAADAAKSAGEPICYDFNAQYIRTNGYRSEGSYPEVNRIGSRAELEEYMERNRKTYDLREAETATEKYTEAWFQDGHVLIVIVVEEPSGSIRHEVTALTAEYVVIERIVPETGTDDMAEWHILVESDFLTELSPQFHVIFTEGEPGKQFFGSPEETVP